jgi:ferredoxin
MSILGIDYTNCTNCGLCVKVCPRGYYEEKEQKEIVFKGTFGPCLLCGHCIAICPQQAILYEDLGDEPYSFEGIENLQSYLPYEKMYNFLRANRSIRFYKSQKVPMDVLKKVISAMECAPTAANLRGEKFVIISEPDQLKMLSNAIIEELLQNPSTRSRFAQSFELKKKIYNSPLYYDAPHIIIVYSSGKSPLEHFNIGNIITYGRLAAQALGLGTCWNGWTQIAFRLNPKLPKLAGIRGRSWGVMTIGYPDIKYVRCPPLSHKKVKGLDKVNSI